MELNGIIDVVRDETKATKDLAALARIRSHYLGKNGLITTALKNLSALSAEDRPKQGQIINQIKVEVLALLQEREKFLNKLAVEQQLKASCIDVTLAGRGQVLGHLHPVTQTRQRVCELFQQLGFEIVEGPEVEDDYHNFTALNFPKNHPSRAMQDTFHLENGGLLRTHTSPVQVHLLETRTPPIRAIIPGRVYRCDYDVTHTPMFHQCEVLCVDENTNFIELKGLLERFLQCFFDCDLKIRFRASYFPFTEPSAEADISCFLCNQEGCRVCHDSGWLEVVGCGMVHPNVLKYSKVDSEKYRGFAFGFGLDRLAMLYYRINDLRILFENDLKFLDQF